MKMLSVRAAVVAVLLGLLVQDPAMAQKRKKDKQMLDKSEAQATSQAPVAAQVEKLRIPYDPNLPMFVVIVEPFTYSASGEMSGGEQSTPSGGVESSGEVYVTDENGNLRMTYSSSYAPAIGEGIAKQLTTALGGWPNIAIAPAEAIKKKPDGSYEVNLQPGEVGPFIIRGTVTEFSETAEMDGRGRGFDSRNIGLATGVIGAITGNRTATAVGAGVAIAGPRYKNERMKRTGMVGMDIQILDGRILRMIPGGTFDCQGSFTTIAAGSDFRMLGISKGDGEMAASSLGNATRAAMNDALQKTRDALLNARR